MLVALAPIALAQVAEQPLHCAADGAIVGLAADKAYRVRLPADAPENPETWAVVDEAKTTGPVNSFTGSFVQVQPDDGSSYNEIYGVGSFGRIPGLDFAFEAAQSGVHTLWLRWTGGDTIGGGDSLYAVMRDGATDALITGVSTYKPALVGLNENPGQFAGCCYTPVTHACPCFAAKPAEVGENSTCAYWIESTNSRYGSKLKCALPDGELAVVAAPRWYLYAGQKAGNVMDFASEPWDATCEAEGTGTADTGLDVASWELEAGKRYRLVFYPREDGTALDAWYLTEPGATPPTGRTVLKRGASTLTCGGDTQTTVAHAEVGKDLEHRDGDAAGWGHHMWGHEEDHGWMHENMELTPSCGTCLVPVEAAACPPFEERASLPTCDNVTIGELCEADGECGTDVRLNNCNPPKEMFDPHHETMHDDEMVGPRWQVWRDNDVYVRVRNDDPRCPGAKGLGAGVVFFIVLLVVCCVGGSAVGLRIRYKRGGRMIPPALRRAAEAAAASTSGPGPLAAADAVAPPSTPSRSDQPYSRAV